MDNLTIIAITSLICATLAITIGSIAPALGEAKALTQALSSIAQQPDEAGNISRTLFVGLAMVESTAIYCLVIAMIILYANPFWDHFIAPK